MNGSRAGERAGVGERDGEGVADMIPDSSLDQSVMDLFHSQGRKLATKRYHDVAAAFQTRAEGGLAMRALARGLERLKSDISHDGAATIAIRCAAQWIAEQKVHDDLQRDPTPPPRMSREELMAELEKRNATFQREQDAIAEAARAARQPALIRTTTSITTTTQEAAR